MRRETRGELIFWSATALAFALYWLSRPDGLPWIGEGVAYPFLWRYCVRMFGGNAVLMSSVAAAVSGGLLGAVANRYLGWRVGVAAALAWVVMPPVWNGAITGGFGVCVASAAVIALWAGNLVFLWATRKAAAVQGLGLEESGTAADENRPPTVVSDGRAMRAKINRIASRALLGAAGFFALVSSVAHDYTYGEAATVYAQGIVEEAGERIILLNGVCDEQVVYEVRGQRLEVRGQTKEGNHRCLTSDLGPLTSIRTISFRHSDAERPNLVAWAKSSFPSETNLWIAAQVSPTVFAEEAVKAHPDRFYAMTGRSTTPEKWAARWAAMGRYLQSGDPFVPVMRRAFAYEGNALANAMLEDAAAGGGREDAAWALYLRVFEEIEPGNLAAAVNLGEMMRRGHPAADLLRSRITGVLADFSKRVSGRRSLAEVASQVVSSGPVMRDRRALDEMRERITARMAELKDRSVPHRLSDKLMTLVAWNNRMIEAYGAGDLAKAARIARTILSRPEGRGFVPASAVLGAALLQEGDFVASEAFYRTAVRGRDKVPAAVLNDYADTLRRLGRLGEAETYGRRAVAESGGKVWVFRLTLAEILRDAGKNPDEVRTLLAGVLRDVPNERRSAIRREFGR